MTNGAKPQKKLRAAGNAAKQFGGHEVGISTVPCPIPAPTSNDYSAEQAEVCQVICKCNASAPTGAAGQQLKQICVSSTLTARDATADYHTTIKAEVSYDMTPPPPPRPLMTKSNPLRPFPVEFLKYHLSDLIPGFKPGVGMVRRPDVVVVKNPNTPPVRENIKAIFEIKFPPETDDPVQIDRYQTIAGDADVVPLSPARCGCGDPQPQEVPVAVPQPAPQPEHKKAPAPGTLETVLLLLALVGLVLDNAVGGEAGDVLIPAIVKRLSQAF